MLFLESNAFMRQRLLRNLCHMIALVLTTLKNTSCFCMFSRNLSTVLRDDYSLVDAILMHAERSRLPKRHHWCINYLTRSCGFSNYIRSRAGNFFCRRVPSKV